MIKNTTVGIMRACDYSISYLQSLKKSMFDGKGNQELAWAMGGIVITLCSHLFKICDEVFPTALQSENPNAEEDLQKIKQLFNEFIDRMINY